MIPSPQQSDFLQHSLSLLSECDQE